MLGKKVKVNVGNDNWGEVINTEVPHLVTKEFDNEYGLCPLPTHYYFPKELTHQEIVEKGYYKFIVNKGDVEEC